MTTITKERLQWLANISGRDDIDDIDGGEIRELALIALASLEAEPVAWVMADDLRDNAIVSTPAYPCLDDAQERTIGSLIALYAAPPVPDVPAVLERLRSIVADPRALPRRKEWVSGQQYSYVLLENVEAMVDEACRAVMLKGDKS
ncbi:TPA: hypothetical protein IGZ89_000744 [Escherichia coli]|nr:hypothetical protein [Escherichia coli]